MMYRDMGRTGVKVSALGYGCMRYPRKGKKIDAERAERQLKLAMEMGVNYFDTAYAYQGGQSEAVLGRAVAGTARDKVYVADKIPPYIIFSRRDLDKTLETMLSRLASERIDFLLVHALNDYTGWERLKSLGYAEFLEAARAAGKICFAGFSWHGQRDEFVRVVDDYPWDFCQIQYNYLDEHFQAGRGGLEYAAAKGLGVVVMEPLRGGSLAGRMPPEVARVVDSAPVSRSAAAWALDWIWNHPGVSTALSGLNEEAHIEENVRLASAAVPGMLGQADDAVVTEIRSAYRKLLRVGCTGCSYCMPCPFGVDIPLAFSMLNSKQLFKDEHIRFQYSLFSSGVQGGDPSAAYLCKECGACEKKCPQHLPIREKLREVDAELFLPAFRPITGALRLMRRLRGGRPASRERKGRE
jgi:uncharacterized protein